MSVVFVKLSTALKEVFRSIWVKIESHICEEIYIKPRCLRKLKYDCFGIIHPSFYFRKQFKETVHIWKKTSFKQKT